MITTDNSTTENTEYTDVGVVGAL